MSLQFSITGGTPKSGPSLCRTCKKAMLIDGQNCEEVVICKDNAIMKPIRFRVAKCTGYHPANVPWMYEMEQMAWVVQARKRGPVGFLDGKPTQEMEVTIEPPDKEQAGVPQA